MKLKYLNNNKTKVHIHKQLFLKILVLNLIVFELLLFTT